MGSPGIDQALDMFDRAQRRFVALVRTLPDAATRVPHLTWTVGDTAAHVLSVLRGYHDVALGAPPLWPDLAHGDEHNARLLAAVPEREPAQLADALQGAVPGLVEVWRDRGDGSVPWHAGLVVPTASIVTAVANDILVHGWDISRALRRRWPISDADSVLAALGYTDILPALVDPAAAAGFSASGVLHLRGGPFITFTFAGPDLVITEESAARADFRISARPSTYNLSSFGRISPWRALATGGMIPYGRKPWLAARMATIFYR